jgi:hypothetical protein
LSASSCFFFLSRSAWMILLNSVASLFGAMAAKFGGVGPAEDECTNDCGVWQQCPPYCVGISNAH